MAGARPRRKIQGAEHSMFRVSTGPQAVKILPIYQQNKRSSFTEFCDALPNGTHLLPQVAIAAQCVCL